MRKISFDERITNEEKKDESFRFYCFLEDCLVGNRLTISELEMKLNKYFHTNDSIYLSKTINWDNADVPDYPLTGTTEDIITINKNIAIYDFEIYVLPTKEQRNHEIVYYITETNLMVEDDE